MYPSSNIFNTMSQNQPLDSFYFLNSLSSAMYYLSFHVKATYVIVYNWCYKNIFIQHYKIINYNEPREVERKTIHNLNIEYIIRIQNILSNRLGTVKQTKSALTLLRIFIEQASNVYSALNVVETNIDNTMCQN